MSPVASTSQSRLAGVMTAVVTLAIVAAPGATGAESQRSHRADAHRLAERMNVAGVRAMGDRFSCAASPAEPASVRLVVYVRSTADRKRARAIADQQVRRAGVQAADLRIDVQVGQQVRARGSLLRIATKLNRQLDSQLGQRAQVAGARNKSRCGRIQLFIGSSPSPELASWARTQRRSYGSSRIRIVRSLLGSAAS